MLVLTQDQMSALLDTLPDPAFVLTASGRYAAIYGGVDSRYYHDGRGLIGMNLQDVLVSEKANWFLAQIQIALASRSLHIVEYGLSGSDVLGLPPDGPADVIWFEGRVQALDFLIQGESAVLWVASNITARHTMERQLVQLSETDALTGLFNRRRLIQTLEEHHQIYVRHNTQTTVVVFDVDLFKSINDGLGHHVGDQVLQIIAAVCQREIRTSDLAARVGGDEFVLVLPYTELDSATELVERLRRQVRAEMPDEVKALQAGTISLGLGTFLPTDKDIDDVLRRADRALYQAKRSGRDRIGVELA